MQCFCRVIESGSFAGAAKSLGWSNAVVTKYVQFLESWTQTRLLARTTRAMRVTPAGERFYEYCRRVLADTEATLESVRGPGTAVDGRLVVAAPVSLSLTFLHDHLHAFRRRHPAVVLEVRLDDRDTDLVRDGVDVALRGRAALDDSGLVAVPLAALERVVCASPTYLATRPRPTHPRDLAHLDCLVYTLASDASTWQFEHPSGEVHPVKVDGTFRANNTLMVVDALRRGLGVGLVPRATVERELADGSLVTLLDGYTAPPRTLYAVYPSRRHLPERARALVEFLKERLREPPR
jgi:DNA-binding transcriptional LysR family regulator